MAYQMPSFEQLPSTALTDGSKKFLNMSAGVLTIVASAVLLICCIGPVALCFLGGFANSLQPKPSVTITGCRIDYDGLIHDAKISYTITNNRKILANYTIEFIVKDSSGNQVGDGSDHTSDIAPGVTANDSATVFLDAKGGYSCHIVSAG